MDEKDRLIKELREALEKEKKRYHKLEKEFEEFKAKHTQTVSELRKALNIKTKLGATQEVRSRYVTDIKLIGKVNNTRHDIHRKYCPTCKKIVESEVPGVLPHARFGLNIMLLILYLRLGLRLPGNKVC